MTTLYHFVGSILSCSLASKRNKSVRFPQLSAVCIVFVSDYITISHITLVIVIILFKSPAREVFATITNCPASKTITKNAIRDNNYTQFIYRVC